MIDYMNPFEYEAAKKLTPEQILEFYIQDFNFSRFVKSRRNIFLVGERGTGKTMTLIYNSFPVQLLKAQKERSEPNLDLICVYIPCNTPLTHRREYQLLEEFQASVISEHFLVLTIMDAIAGTVSTIPDVLEGSDEKRLREDFNYALGLDLRDGRSFFESLRLLFQREATEAQKAINARRAEAFYEDALSFLSGVMPMVNCLKRIPKLAKSHLALMFDDAHDLNPYQIRTLNSWIAYRDNSVFSFKIATTKVDRPLLLTASGGTILEGHDFTLVDMVQPYQNRYSDFGKLARGIVQQRLNNIGVSKGPDEFFPVNPEFQKEIEECENLVRSKAEERIQSATNKQITDYVYKYGRAEYFRRRSEKSNRPPYSGFEMLVHISTGVIRNLLEPCYWMYDKVVSDLRSQGGNYSAIEQIPPPVQTQIIRDRSRRMWEWIKEGLDNSVEGCSKRQADEIYRLFDNLAMLFRERLLHHESEPRAIVFTISDTHHPKYQDLIELLDIARKAQILYTYTSSAKDHGRRESYYVPNRMLWPERGLDPVGQYSRVSLKAGDLWAAAESNKKIPFVKAPEQQQQLGLFDAR
jgi:hypothetical protein